MGASRPQVLTDVTLWESLPQTFVGMRSGVSLALVIVIVAEMFIGSTDGLGQRILKSQMVFDMPDMYASIFAAGALGYMLNLLSSWPSGASCTGAANKHGRRKTYADQ